MYMYICIHNTYTYIYIHAHIFGFVDSVALPLTLPLMFFSRKSIPICSLAFGLWGLLFTCHGVMCGMCTCIAYKIVCA